MNVELFIARRLFSSKENKNQLSQRIVRLSVLAIGLGICIIILASAIVKGFQKEIAAKVDGFAAHAQIINLDSNFSYQTLPIHEHEELITEIQAIPNVTHIQKLATKPGILKINEEIQGVVAKGISNDFDWSFFDDNKVEGRKIELSDTPSKEAWLSSQVAQLLRLKIGDKFLMYFLNEDENLPRIRQFILSGTYKTGLEEFDRMFMLIDLRHIQSLNDWDDKQISGYDIFVNDVNLLDGTINEINSILVRNINEDSNILQVIDIKDKYAAIFDWLGLLDMNSLLIQVLMILVAGFNMISGLLVIILERTQMIGILKSIGATNVNIRKVFLYLSSMLIGRGLLWGNAVGISLCLLQKYLKIIPLDANSYFIDAVPIHFSLPSIIMLNMYSFIIILIMLILPSFIVGRISPEKTIRFD